MANPYKNEKTCKFTTYTEITDKMREVIYELVYTDKTKTLICQECDISTTTLYRWFHWDEFTKELTKERRTKFNQIGDKAIEKLMKLVEQDDDKRSQLNAIKMVLQENGLCNDRLNIDQITTNNIIVTIATEDEE